MAASSEVLAQLTDRLAKEDRSLREINLHKMQLTDAEVSKLVDCLLAHPDVVTHVLLSVNRLSDETGVKLARYVAASSRLDLLALNNNWLTDATYLALAAALHVNTSMQYLYLAGNQPKDKPAIDAAFAEALRVNARRPLGSVWWLYHSGGNDFQRLK